MSFKKELAKEIQILESEIKELETKRTRSMAAVVEAIISHTEPEETEVQFFRTYTAEIEVKREKLVTLTNHLKKIV